MTVTATNSGTGSSNGIILAVRVLNNAAYTQNGVTAHTETVTVPQVTITPGAAGNMVYGGIANGAAGTAFGSIQGTTTSISAQLLTASSAYAGIFKSSSTTTTSSTTYGWGTPSAGSGSIFSACAEIKTNGTSITEDASTPAVVNATGAKTITTAAFTPPAAAVLVAIVEADWTGANTMSIAVTDNTASLYTWTQLVATGTAPISSVWVGIPNSTTANPVSLAASTSFPAPTVRAGEVVTTTSLAASAAFASPSLRTDTNLTTTSLAASAAFPAPGVSITISPAGFAASVSFPAPTIITPTTSTYQYMAPYQVIYLQYLGPPGAFIPALGQTVTGLFTGASNLVVPSPPTDGRWSVNGAFQPRFLRAERDIPRSGWSIHDELCHHCLRRHRHVCQE